MYEAGNSQWQLHPEVPFLAEPRQEPPCKESTLSHRCVVHAALYPDPLRLETRGGGHEHFRRHLNKFYT